MASSDDKVRVNMTSGERTVPLQPAVRHVLEKLRAGDLPEPNRRALLDALGHDDCVPREHRGCHWEHEAQRYAGNADYWRARAERAERERDALRVDNDRLREALSVMDEFVIAAYVKADEDWWEEYNTARAALSADADADAEPSTCGAPHDICGTWCDLPEGHDGECRCICDGDPGHDWLCDLNPCDCGADAELEPSRAELHWPDCHTCNDTGGFRLGGNEYVCKDCGRGRPREADPQGDSPSTGASVDGGGDDGRSRAAIDAEHLERQRRWSMSTFGPGARTHGVTDHIRKELAEIEAEPGDLSEWVDVIILAFDGAWRAGWDPQEIIDTIKAKQAKNEAREWPDWRTQPEDAAIEHNRSGGGDRA